MRSLADIQAIMKKITAQASNGKIDSQDYELFLERGRNVGSVSADSYADQALHNSEIEKVLRRRPLPLLASDEVAKPGEVTFAEILGVPLIVARELEGSVRVYKNSCRHRGARLTVKRESGANHLVCPFHGWSYGINGKLTGVSARRACFDQLSDSAFALNQVESHEFAGMIWVCLAPGQADVFASAFHVPRADAVELGIETRHTFAEHSFVADFNWKIGVEAFLEVYHFTHAHAPYLENLKYPNMSFLDSYGENARILVPLAEPNSGAPVLACSQVMFFIFPATFLLYYSDHVALISLVPIAAHQTRFRYIPLVAKENDRTSESIRKKFEFLQLIIAQDVEILEGIQAGLKASAGHKFVFTQLEEALQLFQKNLSQACREP